MKRRRKNLSQTIFNVVGLVVIVSMVVGGLLMTTISPSKPTPTPSPTHPRPTTPLTTHTPTATSTPTNTPLPSATVTPTMTLLPTATPTATLVAGMEATPIPLGSRGEDNLIFLTSSFSTSQSQPDPSSIHEVRQLVQAQNQAGKTVLISSHVFSEIDPPFVRAVDHPQGGDMIAASPRI